VCKRVSRRIRALDLADGAAYRSYLEGHPEEMALLDGLCRITVSRFYRDRAAFDALRRRGFADLAAAALDRGASVVRCWSAGCASGEEPFSLSLAWAMSGSHRPAGFMLEIVATEVDPRLLERARIACYPRGALKEVPPEWIQTAFDDTDRGVCLRASFRRPVTLVRQDIREAMPEGIFDLVLCRNLVFTYFETGLQTELLAEILGHMHEGGLLVLGGHEVLPRGDWPVDRPYASLPIYRRVEGAAP
jgi:chemotaxis protein methyltransferase CheR